MTILKGDLIKLAIQGKFDVIIHGCNCFCTMGAGIAKQVKATFPTAYEMDLTTTKGDKTKLGSITYVRIVQPTGVLIVVNAYTQYHWKGENGRADYNAIRQAFAHTRNHFSGKRIAYPAIGAGLAGGDWSVIKTIIDQELENEEHFFVHYQR